ncbi:MAG: DUF4296 domain-containing protein [Bacteroidetes bacterium]|nr:DUF4296 domain-containing protein [Bacteroidota bacterium]
MRLIIFGVCLVLLTACNSDGDIPKGVIAKEEMGKIFWDMVQADQYAIQYLTKDSLKDKVKPETMKLYEEIFRIHHISKEEFKKSLEFYEAHPDITKSIFDSLSASANRRRIELFKNQTRPIKKPD